MRCPKCLKDETKVVDSRPVEEEDAIRRRRECEACEFRFSTYEQVEILDLAVIKRDGHREPYSREKLERGFRHSFWKLPHTDGTIRKLSSGIEQDIQKKASGGEISSQEIGDIVMKRLRKTSKPAYIRFAAVYRQFEDIADFKEELSKL
jgi:transcriptional repressor NrdR